MMNDKRIPTNFPGGYSFEGEFAKVPLAVGQVWRKHGPVDALKIVRIVMPDFEHWDGASPGVSCRHSIIGRNGRIVWERGRTWFHPAASQEDFWQQMKESHRAPVVDEVKA